MQVQALPAHMYCTYVQPVFQTARVFGKQPKYYVIRWEVNSPQNGFSATQRQPCDSLPNQICDLYMFSSVQACQDTAKTSLLVVDSVAALIPGILNMKKSMQGHCLMVQTSLTLKQLAERHQLAVILTSYTVAGLWCIKEAACLSLSGLVDSTISVSKVAERLVALSCSKRVDQNPRRNVEDVLSRFKPFWLAYMATWNSELLLDISQLCFIVKCTSWEHIDYIGPLHTGYSVCRAKWIHKSSHGGELASPASHKAHLQQTGERCRGTWMECFTCC